MDLIQSALVSAVVGAIVGGLAGFVVARLQRTWDLDARRAEDRRARLRAAIDVVLRFLDAVDRASSLGGPNREPVSLASPLRQLTRSDRWAISSVLRLFPDQSTWAGFFYPPTYLSPYPSSPLSPSGQVVTGNGTDYDWREIVAFAGARLAKLTAELERLGDADLRNFAG
jgi:hypothetical protein